MATGAAGDLFSGLQGAGEQTNRGWQRKKDEIEIPERMQKILRLDEESGEGSSGGRGGGPKESRAGVAAAGAATGSAFGYDQSSEDDTRTDDQVARDDQMMILTRKMIEIRNILQNVGQS